MIYISRGLIKIVYVYKSSILTTPYKTLSSNINFNKFNK